MGHIQVASVIPGNREKVFGHLANLSERSKLFSLPDVRIELTSMAVPLESGAEFEVKIHRFGFQFPFTYMIEDFKQNESFAERQISGFFEEWRLLYKFEDHGNQNTLLTNVLEFKIPMGILGTLADDLFARFDIEKKLKQLHENLQKLLQ